MFKPGEYEIIDGESVFDILQFSGGLLNSANSNSLVLINNQSNNNFTVENSKDIMVKNSDLIIVNSISKKDVPTVEIKGQVSFPGTYFLEDKLTVNQLINNAGGYTKYADSINIEINNKNLMNVTSNQIDIEGFKDINFYTEHDISYLSSRYRTKHGQNKSEKEFLSDMELIDGDIITVYKGKWIITYTF